MLTYYSLPDEAEDILSAHRIPWRLREIRMIPPNTNQQPYPMSPSPKKAFPMVRVVLGAVGVLIVLAIVGGIKAFHAVKASSSEAIAVGNNFIDDMGQHRFQAARLLFVPEAQEKTSLSDTQDIETLVEKHHGAYVSHGQPQWFIQNFNGQTSVRLTYPAQFTRSNDTISIVLLETNQGYRVYGIHYDL